MRELTLVKTMRDSLETLLLHHQLTEKARNFFKAVRLGDFVEMSESLDSVDVTVLDKVVCCYPDSKELIRATLDCTSRVIALTYPRKHLLGEIYNKIWNFGFWLFRSDFRSFMHEPRLVQESIEAGGFKRWWRTRNLDLRLHDSDDQCSTIQISKAPQPIL